MSPGAVPLHAPNAQSWRVLIQRHDSKRSDGGGGHGRRKHRTPSADHLPRATDDETPKPAPDPRGEGMYVADALGPRAEAQASPLAAMEVLLPQRTAT